ncbi:MAG TPA: class I SAM-dependent methyltransferase [Pyrinomonadaceae bacterium]|nr:class I SAM-dependent methyltransferase [Pyrinomonadaceae bacterium]
MIKQEGNINQSCPMCDSPITTVKFVKVYMKQRWSLRRCSKCGLHFTDPQPTPAFLEQCYSGDFHSELQAEGATEQYFGAKYQRYLNYLSTYLPPGGRVLDIGCATGLLVKMLCDQGYRAEGIDLNPLSAEWGRKHYNVTIHNKPLEGCSFKFESFDAVILTDVLEHTLHPRNYLATVGKYLAHNGVGLITFPDVRSLESRYFFLLAQLMRRPWLWKNCYIPLHIWEFTKATAIACFEGAGFYVSDFRRSQDAASGSETGLLKLINIPPSILSWPPLATQLGTQMEFIIRRAQPNNGMHPTPLHAASHAS